MMQSGESEIFTKAGVEQVFYSETLIGSRLPNLTYMLAFDNLADRDKKWARFELPMNGRRTRRNPSTRLRPSSPRSTILSLRRLPIRRFSARNLTATSPGMGVELFARGAHF